MLVLADTDGLRIDLDQFRQRIHQPASDGDGPTDGDIIIGKLVTGRFGGRVDGSTLFADNKDLYGTVELLVRDEVFRFAAGSSVTDGDGLYLVSFNHFAEFRSRFSFFVYRRVRIDVFIVYEIALCIEADHLTTGAKAGIDTHYPFLSQGWGKKQLAQVFGKDPDRFVIGLCFY